ncbi:ArnT family glycosyltransferase [Azorhizobium doebereinerae]|uniref:ArnT family glycosyltransferase n=1 Tax=Azorhizobium doebereinerae TaxID=281091 RepID=UPI0004917148|nr:hypothetical protein [Azorhizobium doebereinerae]
MDGAAASRRTSLALVALKGLLFLIFVALAVVLIAVQQRAMGGYGSEISADNADEASHFISGLMLADYVRAGFPNPMAFAVNYYLHLPKLAIGHWPPLYYMLEGALFLALPPTTPVALLLPAVLAALLVVTTGWVTARVLGPLQGLAAGAVLLSVPPLREATLVIQLDLPVALLGLLAACAYARFLRTLRAGPAVAFGLLASAAILTKGTGMALALLPPLCLLFGGRFELLRRWTFWLPLPIVALLAGPWTLLTYARAAAGFQYGWGSAFTLLAARTYADGLVAAVGAPVLSLAALGLVFAVVRGWRRSAGAEIWMALAALAVGTLAFQCLVPAGIDPRYLLPLVAPLVMLVAFGATALIGLVTQGWPTLSGLAVALVLLFGALPGLMVRVEKKPIGMDAAAQALLAREAANPLVLVGSDAMGEGALVSAVAQHDRARRTVVLRGTKMLAKTGWNATDYQPLYADPTALLAGLDQMGVGFVAVDTTPAAQALLHDRQLLAAAEAHPDRFHLVATYPRADGAGEVRLYALAGNEAKVPDMAALSARLIGDKAF